jgi:hypothetical protein
MNTKNVLVGRVLTGVQIAEDKEALRFLTDGGEVIARCDADCCSHTWVESVDLPARGFPALVPSVENIELNADKDTQDGELQFYGCKIATDKGDIIIDYRNESNGYYGGSLSWPPDEHFYGGVYGQNVSNEKWVALEPSP